MIEYVGDVPVEAVEPKEPEERDFFAAVGDYSASGITLLFNGANTPTTKRYKYNTGIDPALWVAGARVKCLRISGTILVEYPI